MKSRHALPTRHRRSRTASTSRGASSYAGSGCSKRARGESGSRRRNRRKRPRGPACAGVAQRRGSSDGLHDHRSDHGGGSVRRELHEWGRGLRPFVRLLSRHEQRVDGACMRVRYSAVRMRVRRVVEMDDSESGSFCPERAELVHRVERTVAQVGGRPDPGGHAVHRRERGCQHAAGKRCSTKGESGHGRAMVQPQVRFGYGRSARITTPTARPR